MFDNFLGLPDEATMAGETYLPENQDYFDLRGLTWEFVRTVLHEEDELVGMTPDDRYESTGSYEALMLGVDFGLASCVAALSALGCVPVTSCSGEEGHHEDQPLVVFWCPEESLKIVIEAATAVGVALDCVSPRAIMVSATSGELPKMRAFARALLDRAA